MKVSQDILAQCDPCYLSVKESGGFATETLCLVKFTIQLFLW